MSSAKEMPGIRHYNEEEITEIINYAFQLISSIKIIYNVTEEQNNTQEEDG